MQSNNNTKGVLYPTTQGMIADNPQNSAIKQVMDTAKKAANLNAAVGGTVKRRRKYGGAIEIPQYTNMLYTPTNGPSEHPNNQIVDVNKISTQSYENRKYDYFAKIGGAKKKRIYKKGSTKRKSSTKRKTKRVSGGKKSKKLKKSKNGGKLSNPDWKWNCYS